MKLVICYLTILEKILQKKREIKHKLVTVNVINALLERITIIILKREKYVKVVLIKTEENNCVFDFDNVDISNVFFLVKK